MLNSADVARKLLEKQSANFSGRPWVAVIGEMCVSFVSLTDTLVHLSIVVFLCRMGWSNSLPFLDYGDKFRRQRRLMTQYFNPRNVGMFNEAQEQGVYIFLNDLLNDPYDFRDITQRYDINMRYTYHISF